ncbi:MAG: hypothetical protein KJP04_06135, partial [Arenicella sp.]|nr:hypothetical protein [Arenicella sp.]
PQQKVMIDPRYFPFASWYGEWANLSKNPTYELLSNYDCTVWAINFGYYSLVKTLRASPDWQLVFVGAAGAVFAKKSSLEERWTTQTGEDLWHVSVPTRAMRSLSLLLDNKDLKLALQLAEKMKQNFRDTRSESKIEKAYAYAHGLVAYYKRDYAAAYKLVKKSQAQPTAINNKRLLVRVNLFLTADLWDNGRYKEAQETALEGVKLAPTELAALYNAGTLLLSVPNTDVGSSNWREHLEKFVRLGKQSSRVPAKFVNIAESALESGTLSLTKPLVPENRPAKLDPLTLY